MTVADSDMIVTLATGKSRVNNTITPKTYTVQKGDSLYKIARKMYGDGALWSDLYDRNTSTLKHPCLLKEGMVLYL